MLSQLGDFKPLDFTKANKTLAALIAKPGPKASLDELDSIGNGRFVTVTLSVDAKSYNYHIFDLSVSTDTKISRIYFKTQHARALVSTETMQIIARDGMQLDALLLRPKGVESGVPMVLEVHGGPAR